MRSLAGILHGELLLGIFCVTRELSCVFFICNFMWFILMLLFAFEVVLSVFCDFRIDIKCAEYIVLYLYDYMSIGDD